MSLYHETAQILSDASKGGGGLKNRVFGKREKGKELKSPPGQVYALAVESCRWSGVLKEVIEASGILMSERKLTPILALLLVHDHLLAKSGIALPASHGLRATIERHKARLASELTRARIRRHMSTLEALRAHVLAESRAAEDRYPRWVRVNALKTDVDTQLETTFSSLERVHSVAEVMAGEGRIHIDEHVPGLLAMSPGFEVTKTAGYESGALILQDKASCFPAYLLDPDAGDGDVVDACAAPGNKTTHLAAILHSRRAEGQELGQSVFGIEKDPVRAKTLARMVERAGAKGIIKVALGQDFMKLDPADEKFSRVGALLLDPSCSGSGIVGRDSMPELHLAEPVSAATAGKKGDGKKKGGAKKKGEDGKEGGKKRKRGGDGEKGEEEEEAPVMVDDDGNVQTLKDEQELAQRLRALAGFQLKLLLHALEFPAARRVSYSTCSVHREENEGVVMAALGSEVARRRGWRVLRREEQVSGMREWPVRGEVEACGGDEGVAGGCVRSYKGDGRGVMGFFVAAFVRDAGEEERAVEEEPYVRDEEGMIVRDAEGMPLVKATGEFASVVSNGGGGRKDEGVGEWVEEDASDASSDDSEEGEDDEGEWGGFDD
ncbi:related to NOL1R protein [Cephalotrichum gorgonifer]|uniref:Related to NOL1R protein n=1 Tax=Cephalotrichum gorgonifer TaxID=2041049 RepID=A0AAE8N231_9PEZI|nr:related to NOL1R protein [Cephalotrichum gorgonifer]